METYKEGSYNRLNSHLIEQSKDIDSRNEKPNRDLQARQIFLEYFRDKTLKYNLLSQQIELDGEPYEPDLEYITVLGYKHNLNYPKGKVIDLITAIAKEMSYHPLLDALKEKRKETSAKGYEPLDTSIYANKYLKVSFDHPHYKLFNAYLVKHLIGSVARLFEPGCQMQTILILQGKQGIGKSSFFRNLYGNSFYNENFGSADIEGQKTLDHAWCHEIPEIEKMLTRVSNDKLKGFFSQGSDIYRASYARHNKRRPRWSVFVGTTNESEFFTDFTGNRRYWVIPIDESPDIDQLLADRGDIWGTALYYYDKEFIWWLTDDEQKEQEKLNKQYLIADSWESLILEKIELHDKQYYTTKEIAVNWLDFPMSQINRKIEMRIADILKKLGYVTKVVWIKGKSQRVWQKN